MGKKILLSMLFFLFLFIVIYSFGLESAAFTVSYDGQEYDFGDVQLYEYTFVHRMYNDDGELIRFCYVSSHEPCYIEKSNGEDIICILGQYLTGYMEPDTGYVRHEGPFGSDGRVSRYPGDYIPNIFYANYDIKNEEGEVIFGDSTKITFNLSVEPSEETTNVPVVVSTQYYTLDVFMDILVQYSYDEEDWENLEWARVTDSSSPYDGMYRFYLDVYENDTYYFRLCDLTTMEYQYEEIVIDNIVYTQDNAGDYVDGVFRPTPFLSYEYVSDSEIYITTQKFFIHELIDLQCYWAKDVSGEDFNDMSKWTKVENTRVFKDQISGEDVYQFYFSVKNDAFDADGIYYVKFYNVFLDEWTHSSIEIDFETILMRDGSLLFKYVTFFRERFGFLIYPFDLAINVLNKVKAIEFEEPSFDIPDLYEPFTHTKLISATHFNFNDLLENEVFETIHNIYFVIVDVIIVFALVSLLKKKIMEVFDK